MNTFAGFKLVEMQGHATIDGIDIYDPLSEIESKSNDCKSGDEQPCKKRRIISAEVTRVKLLHLPYGLLLYCITFLPYLDAIQLPGVCKMFRQVLQEKNSHSVRIGWVQYAESMNLFVSNQQIMKTESKDINDLKTIRSILETHCIYLLGKRADRNGNANRALEIFKIAANRGHLKAQYHSLRILRSVDTDPNKEYKQLLEKMLESEFLDGWEVHIDKNLRPEEQYKLRYRQYQSYKALLYHRECNFREEMLAKLRLSLDGTIFAPRCTFAALSCGGNFNENRLLQLISVAPLPKAYYLLGDLFYYGDGVDQDYVKAAEWYHKAARCGHCLAQFRLGYMFHNGKGVEQNYTKALEFYDRAAEQGDTYAQTNLGNTFYYANGVKQNYTNAFILYKKAAEQGHPDAQNNLGNMFIKGHSVEQSYSKALEWYHKAAEQGHKDAQNSLGNIFYYGENVAQDYRRAAEWYEKAANQGHLDSQFKLGLMFYNGTGVEQSYTRSIQWFQKAAEQGDADAQNNLGVIFKNGIAVDVNYQIAIEWLHKAVRQGHASAQNNLGLIFYHGNGVEQNYTKAFELFKRAAKQGDSHAQNNLGVMFRYGQGIEQNHSKAIKYFQRAAEQGHSEAQNNLDSMLCYSNNIEQNSTDV